MTMKDRHLYCIGLAGVGVSAIAKYYLRQGWTVSGSDPRISPLVDDLIKLGVKYYRTADPSRIARPLDLVVYSDDVPAQQSERQAAIKLGIRSLNFAAALGEIMAHSQQRLAIAGTNGKSTTAAMTGLIFTAAGLNPHVFVGSRVNQFTGNLRLGDGRIFIAEADEYRNHFWQMRPSHLTITNVELDHVDFFHDITAVINSFQHVIDELDTDGRLVINADDPICRRWSNRLNAVTFGFNESAIYQASNYRVANAKQTFILIRHGRELGQIDLYVPGRINAANALAAATTALEAGVSFKDVTCALADFKGIWRRFEILNPAGRILVVNDYAHHPTAVRATIAAAKSFYPGRRVWAVFQPHHHHRLASLFDDFVAAFDQAERVIIVEVYAVPGRENMEQVTVTGENLATAIAGRGKNSQYAADSVIAQRLLEDQVRNGDIILIMGAGDIWEIGQPLATLYGS